MKGSKNRHRLIDLTEVLRYEPPKHKPIGRDIQVELDEVFKRVDMLSRMEQLIYCEDSRVAAMILVKLLEYRYGKPQERVEITGQLDVRGVIAQARARVLAQRTEQLTDGTIIDAEVVPEAGTTIVPENPPENETK